MKRNTVLITIAIAGLVVCSAWAKKNSANRLAGSADGAFMTKAAQGGMAEVELGNLAVERASSPKVKEFGQRMVTDHSKANDDLKALSSKKGMTPPSGLDGASQATKDKLSRLNGADFDHAYMQDMVKDHQKDIAEFQKEADHGSDPDVKAFASKTLPTLQDHLRMAQDTLAAVKK